MFKQVARRLRCQSNVEDTTSTAVRGKRHRVAALVPLAPTETATRVEPEGGYVAGQTRFQKTAAPPAPLEASRVLLSEQGGVR